MGFGKKLYILSCPSAMKPTQQLGIAQHGAVHALASVAHYIPHGKTTNGENSTNAPQIL